MHRGAQFGSCISGELESRSLSALCVPLLDRVFESAGCANYRHRAVAHTVNLGESTRFIPRRHQKNVRTGLHQVSEAVIIGDLDAKPIWEAFVEGSEHRLVMDIAGSEYQEDHLLREKLRQ